MKGLLMSNSILNEIFNHKRVEIAHSRRNVPLDALMQQVKDSPPGLDFLKALKDAPHRPALIAEVKQRSPSRGQLAQQFDPLALARIYAQNGASAISVLTDERYFGGSCKRLVGYLQGSPCCARISFAMSTSCTKPGQPGRMQFY
jgi:indole-3-glycerol phosphate synthase